MIMMPRQMAEMQQEMIIMTTDYEATWGLEDYDVTAHDYDAKRGDNKVMKNICYEAVTF